MNSKLTTNTSIILTTSDTKSEQLEWVIIDVSLMGFLCNNECNFLLCSVLCSVLEDKHID